MKRRTACFICFAFALTLLAGCPRRSAHGRTKAKEKPEGVKMRDNVMRDAARQALQR